MEMYDGEKFADNEFLPSQLKIKHKEKEKVGKCSVFPSRVSALFSLRG